MTENTLQQIAAVLRTERQRRGLTQEELAELLGLTREYLCQLERGRGTQQLARLIRALNAVGVDLVAQRRS